MRAGANTKGNRVRAAVAQVNRALHPRQVTVRLARQAVRREGIRRGRVGAPAQYVARNAVRVRVADHDAVLSIRHVERERLCLRRRPRLAVRDL